MSLYPFAKQHIRQHSTYELVFTQTIHGRVITLRFVTEDKRIRKSTYTQYARWILCWIAVLDTYAQHTVCTRSPLTLYLFLTSLPKQTPTELLVPLEPKHANTGFTETCPARGAAAEGSSDVLGEIVVYRWEEWFKVCIHETLHHFRIDFSDHLSLHTQRCIQSAFPGVTDRILLFEAYTETWAEFIHTVLMCFWSQPSSSSALSVSSTSATSTWTVPTTLLHHVYACMDVERNHSVAQMTHVLASYHPDMTLHMLLQHSPAIPYREHTNVVAYYVLKTIALVSYPAFLSWCRRITHHHTMRRIQFPSSVDAQLQFCQFLHTHTNTHRLVTLATLDHWQSTWIKHAIHSSLRMTAHQWEP
jgi:hypothetical protein